MGAGQVGLVAAFLAGLVSFLSPCVLPLYPAYISFMTGMSVAELTDEDRHVGRVIVPVALFVAGFTFVFVALGASASALGSVLSANRQLLTRVAGGVIVVMGVLLLDVLPLRLPQLGSIDSRTFARYGRWAALALGIAFPFALGACAGPVYGAILTLAIDARSVGTGALLLFVYSLGLAVPFVVTSLLLERMTVALKWFSRHAKTVNRIAGVILVCMGVAMLFGVFDRLALVLRGLPIIGGIG